MIDGMGSTADTTRYAVPMEISHWTTIDGVMDNQIHDLRSHGWEVPEGQEDWGGQDERDPYWQGLTELGESIRQAGWDQLPDWPAHHDELQRWAASTEIRAVQLTAAQWGLVLAALELWAVVDEETDDGDSAARLRSIAAEVKGQLAEQGLTAVPQPELNP
jgi:hypothetical protein